MRGGQHDAPAARTGADEIPPAQGRAEVLEVAVAEGEDGIDGRGEFDFPVVLVFRRRIWGMRSRLTAWLR